MLKFVTNDDKRKRSSASSDRIFKDDDVSSCSSGYGSLYSSTYSRPKSCFLESILELDNLPCAVSIVPSRRNKYYGFDADSSNDLTIIKNYKHTDVTCLSKTGKVRLPMTLSTSVNFVPLVNDVTLATAANVKAYRKKSRVSWMVSTTRFAIGEENFEPGQIFSIHSRASVMKKRYSGLRVIPYPNGKFLYIPYDRVGNFKLCASPEIKITKSISDIIKTETPPYLIILPSNQLRYQDISSLNDTQHEIFDMTKQQKKSEKIKSKPLGKSKTMSTRSKSIRSSTDTITSSLYVYEKTTSHLLIAMEITENDDKIVHTIPVNLPIEVTVNSCEDTNLFSSKDLKLVEEKLIKVDIEYALRHHQECFFDELGVLPKRKASVGSIMSLYDNLDEIINENIDEKDNSILLDTTDDILKHFLKFHVSKEEKLPSEQFYKKTGSLKKVASFWSICEEEEIIDSNQVSNNKTINNKTCDDEITTPSIIITNDISGNTNKKDGSDKNKKRLSVSSTNRNRLSRLFNMLTGKALFRPRKALLPEQCKMTPRNSCPYLDFHQVDVESECMKILQELTKRRNSENINKPEESPIKAKLLNLKK